jgi:hypothetical protein
MKNLFIILFLLFPTLCFAATFGQTSYTGGWTYTGTGDRVDLIKATLTEAGTVSKLSALIWAGSGTVDVKGLIYDDDGAGGTPGTLLGNTGAIAVGTGENWKDLTFSSGIPLNAGDYWLAVVFSTDTNIDTKDMGGGSGNFPGYESPVNAYASPPDPWTVALSNMVDEQWSIYATYTAGGGATGIPSNLIHKVIKFE